MPRKGTNPYRSSTFRRSCHRKSRRLYERTYNIKLPYWVDVHHKNGDYADIRIENLVALDEATHNRVHFTKHSEPIRWKRPEHKKYQREYKKRIRVVRICARCGASFTCDKYHKGLCCSVGCYLRGMSRGSSFKA
jgi:hypothetical protein